MIDTYKKYVDTHGPITTPVEYNDYCTFVGRQLGKTTVLLDTLPDDQRSIVICINGLSGKHMLNYLRLHRPKFDTSLVTFVPYHNGRRIDRVRGIQVPIYFDNAVIDKMTQQIVVEYNMCSHSS